MRTNHAGDGDSHGSFKKVSDKEETSRVGALVRPNNALSGLLKHCDCMEMRGPVWNSEDDSAKNLVTWVIYLTSGYSIAFRGPNMSERASQLILHKHHVGQNSGQLTEIKKCRYPELGPIVQKWEG
jgi:hypothetical protein